MRNGFSENLAELSRALHFGHKSGDGQYLSLLEEEGVYMDQNFILGQEFESFSQNGPVIESGINLKKFALYDTFLAISPARVL